MEVGVSRCRVALLLVILGTSLALPPLTVASPPVDYASWKSQNFTEQERANEAISGPSADPDADGLSNAEEYAFFLDPRSFSNNPVDVSFTNFGQATYLTASYKRRKGTTDLVFSTQFSSDLDYWTPGISVFTSDNLDGSETVAVRDNTPTQDPPGRRFARIQVNDQTTWVGLTPGSGVSMFLNTPNSTTLRNALTDAVGTGPAYFVGGALGTPASATLTNATGLSLTTGVSGVLSVANGGTGTSGGFWDNFNRANTSAGDAGTPPSGGAYVIRGTDATPATAAGTGIEIDDNTLVSSRDVRFYLGQELAEPVASMGARVSFSNSMKTRPSSTLRPTPIPPSHLPSPRAPI